MSSFPLTTGRLLSYFFCFIQLISPIKNANHFVFLISHAAIIGPAKLLMSPTITWNIAFSMPAFSKTALIDAANKEQGNMKIVDGRFEPFIYAIRLQNAGLYHALEKMPQYNKYAGDDFYIKDEAPTYYGDEAEVDDCLIADGCRIEGHVENCVLFRDVEVEKGAVLKDCIIMEGGRILSEASLKHVVTDRNVVVRNGRTMMGHENYPITIAKNSTI